jgi:hypothetical protein
MHIPIDNLYDWISGISHDLLIYRFYPHGSKNLECLDQSDTRHAQRSWINNIRLVPVICYDQEPLDHARYDNLNCSNFNLCVLFNGQTFPNTEQNMQHKNSGNTYLN